MHQVFIYTYSYFCFQLTHLQYLFLEVKLAHNLPLVEMALDTDVIDVYSKLKKVSRSFKPWWLLESIFFQTVQLSDAQKEKVAQYTVDCIKQTGVKPEVIAEVKKGHITNDEGLKNFTLCFFQKTGIIGSDGKLNVGEALSKLPPGVDKVDAAKLFEECKMKTGKTAEDTAFEIFKCYHSGTKTHIML